MVKKEEALKVEGRVGEPLPNAILRVELSNGHKVLAHVSGKMRQHYIRILPKDRVVVEFSPHNLTRGPYRQPLQVVRCTHRQLSDCTASNEQDREGQARASIRSGTSARSSVATVESW